jgi:hypothetical protein
MRRYGRPPRRVSSVTEVCKACRAIISTSATHPCIAASIGDTTIRRHRRAVVCSANTFTAAFNAGACPCYPTTIVGTWAGTLAIPPSLSKAWGTRPLKRLVFANERTRSHCKGGTWRVTQGTGLAQGNIPPISFTRRQGRVCIGKHIISACTTCH